MQLRGDLKVALMQHMGNDQAIAAAARVSTLGKASADVSGNDEGLINFLMKNRHGTPFEHGSLTVLVEAPIFVFREWQRHRAGWSYNEESGRYKELAGVFYVPVTNRPMRQVGKPGHYTYVEDGVLSEDVAGAFETVYVEAFTLYQRLLANGVAKEVARMCLPVATYSSMYATCNPRSLMHFLSLRTQHEDSTFPSFPMFEIRECADQLEAIFQRLFPVTHAAFVKHGRVCP